MTAPSPDQTFVVSAASDTNGRSGSSPRIKAAAAQRPIAHLVLNRTNPEKKLNLLPSAVLSVITQKAKVRSPDGILWPRKSADSKSDICYTAPKFEVRFPAGGSANRTSVQERDLNRAALSTASLGVFTQATGRFCMHVYNRRQFGLTVAGASVAGILPSISASAVDPPLETKIIRLKKSFAICFAPYYVVEAFLYDEGFSDVQYIHAGSSAISTQMLDDGRLDFDLDFAGKLVHDLDAGRKITALGGLHVGCYELFAREPIYTIGDLKGRRVGINGFHGGEHLYISAMVAYVGLDPKLDIEWVTEDSGSPLELFAAGETDAFLGFPPEPQMLRARGYNRVILNTVLDHPWSQYFCCVMFGSRAWVRDRPVATKRFLRAMYKAADFCTANPAQAAQQLVDGGYAERYDYALETILSVPYNLWHEYDAEETMRFYALRLHDAGMLKTPPNALLAEGTDWRLLNELKREMKG